jgi:UDP-N-acetylmuramoylalanine--D-glutamate ligase
MNAETSAIRSLSKLGLDESSRVLVVGLGATGLSVARFLSNLGIKLAVADTREKPPGLEQLREWLPDVAVFLGGFDAVAFDRATHLVVSPGVALETPIVQQAMRAGKPVFGDLDLFASVAGAPVIAITGSNGKSTVTTLLGVMAEASNRTVRVGGNLGTPMLDLLDRDAEFYILELSSFQLERSSLLDAQAATVLNISPDHMDRYSSLQAYAEAKRLIFRGQGLMVLNADDPTVQAMAEDGRRCVRFSLKEAADAEYRLATVGGEAQLVRGSQPLLPVAELRIKGRHNIANALAAIALGDAIGLPDAAMVQAMREFSGLDHRMQWVANIGGVTFINDSKATNVGACVAALEGLSEPAVLIAGGDGKGADFTQLVAAVGGRVRAVVLMGRDAPLLERVLNPVAVTVRVDNMPQAVAAARQLAQTGDIVLLAPACASQDQYKDYQERGRLFAQAVRSLL